MTVREQIIGAMKRPKSAVHYGKGTSHSNCGLCEYYSRHECEKVQGVVNSDMICDLFERAIGRDEE